ncbi:MAG: elongation factor P, partial [Acidimicrobiia bacterium]|nr:elongation factor P [Acidimicrobiia bacterium]
YRANPIGVELPASVELEVTYAEPAVRGDTVSGATKQVTMETGLTVQVPLFIEQGERLRIATTDGSYLSRA